ncbi:hypothetical protein ARMA_0629 [Ardenticatena maritima]|uniref:Leucyl aminopeptidase n=1 Tax=Ardenticatena maritima TaxID=872965 RepID=A0A0M8K817_9CHLR|nr:aminopeptidase [Ardenticatena maritima]KPL89696.1 hypothetical protein SE16_04690 [Ardenticatena maritima]GAP62206.1 hypothetical protein ARMA_0629 [Ardenticatena maritima]
MRSLSPEESARRIIRELLAVQPGERVMIICDRDSEMEMAHALANEVDALGGEYVISIMPSRSYKQANELPAAIAKSLEEVDCMIGLTRASGAPTYAQAVKVLYNARRLRAISMVMRTMQHFTRGGALADYRQLHAEGVRLAAIWQQARTIRVTTPLGTDIRANIGNAAPIIECGFATQPGQEAAFPDGEVSQGPNEGTAEGVIVVDGPICHVGIPDEPVRLTVKQGRVVTIEGGKAAAELRRIVEEVENADNIAEFGIGLNPNSLHNGDFEEEKKARGNVHIALGDNIFYGGQTQSAVHMDMVLYRPTVWLDETIVVQDGVLTFL